MGTMAEALIERGKAEGLELGKAEGLELGKAEGLELGKAEGLELGKVEGLELGKAEGLTRIIERRFGPLSQTVRDRITLAGSDELDTWFDRVLDADNLEVMFDGTDPH